MQKNEVGPSPYAIYKINSKWVRYLNVRVKTITAMEENLGGELFDIRFGNNFLDIAPEAQATIEKKNWTSSELNMCASEVTINRVKRQPTEWEKIFSNHRGINIQNI